MRLIRYIKRIHILKKRGWYKSLSGKYVEGHLQHIVKPSRLYKMSDKEFEALLD